ncbi:LpqN/LpqT family lipoprotein [Rhodococcus phenolicus]|uniref:LpqN/LpqT family lipoprotein n=1 Tax=Rhodococcus phenolicus TaxID=263849 RepID=UPI000834E512|nr:LpqN/LpqT family lipoprotein [Rhodococcus phenolicus]
MIPRFSDTNTLRAYLDAHEVALVSVHPGDPGHPDVAIPLPDGWAEVAHDVFPQAHTVIVAPEYIIDDWSPNAVLLHGRMSRWRPTDELLDVAGSEALALPEWNELRSSATDFHGHRSVFVHGTYRVEGVEFTAATRYLVIDDEYDRYLTQLTVTTRADPPLVLATDAAAIHTGFSVRTTPGTDASG